jgi:hypothetical protein
MLKIGVWLFTEVRVGSNPEKLDASITLPVAPDIRHSALVGVALSGDQSRGLA